MELDDLKAAWQTLDARLSRQNQLQFELLRERKLDTARRGLRGLVVGQWLQLLLGVGLILLGVACWTRNTDVPGLFATGVALHAFGVLTTVLAAITVVLVGTVDYAAPVTTIQRQLARLQRFHALNANLCGAPWWVMWVLVVVGFAGLGKVDPGASTPAWIIASFWIGIVGTLATWTWAWHRGRRAEADLERKHGDGGDGIRRSRRLLDELVRFEQE